MGETSGSVVRQLSLGKPVVVSDVGWFSELPAEVALKVPVDEREVETLHAALELLAAREDVRAAMGAAAAELTRREHDLERVAELYAAALEQAAGGEAVADAVLGEVATRCCRGRDRAGVGRAGGARAQAGRGRAWSLARRGACRRGAGSPAIVGVSFLLRAWLARGMVGPFIMVDELIYSELARSFAADGAFQVRDAPAAGFSLVYPVLISPGVPARGRAADGVRGRQDAERRVHVARRRPRLPARPADARTRRSRSSRRCSRWRVPSMVYTGTVMTENVFYPLFLTAALALVLVLEKPTLARQIGALRARRALLRDPRAGGGVHPRDPACAAAARRARPAGRCAT